MTNVENTPSTPSNADPFDFDQFRLPQNFAGMMSVMKEILTIPVGRPDKQDFVRVCPKPFYEGYLLELRSGKEIYLVSPNLHGSLERELVAKKLYKEITRQGDLFLWPVRLPDINGKLDTWNTSAHQAAAIAQNTWVRVVSNQAISSYHTLEPMMHFPDPQWPNITDEKVMSIAFKDRLIKTLDHPAVKKLRGEL